METETTRRKLIPAISQDTLVIIGMFRQLDAPEKIITKKELTKAIGRDPMGLIPTALRHMLRDYNTVVEWDRSRGGWRNMVGNDNLLRRKVGVTSLRHKAIRESEKLSVIDFGKLNDPQKIEACAVMSLFGPIGQMCNSNGIKRIESAVQKADAAGLPVGKTLALFAENGKTGPDPT